MAIAAAGPKITTRQHGPNLWNVYLETSGNTGTIGKAAASQLVGYIRKASVSGQFQYTAFTSRNARIGTPKFNLAAAADLIGKTLKTKR